MKRYYIDGDTLMMSLLIVAITYAWYASTEANRAARESRRTRYDLADAGVVEIEGYEPPSQEDSDE